MLEKHLPYAYSHELAAKVIARPTDEDMAKVQGYANVRDWQRDNIRKRGGAS